MLEFLFAIPFPTDHFFAFQRKPASFHRHLQEGKVRLWNTEVTSATLWSQQQFKVSGQALLIHWCSLVYHLSYRATVVVMWTQRAFPNTRVSKEIFIMIYQLIIRPWHFIEVSHRVSNIITAFRPNALTPLPDSVLQSVRLFCRKLSLALHDVKDCKGVVPHNQKAIWSLWPPPPGHRQCTAQLFTSLLNGCEQAKEHGGLQESSPLVKVTVAEFQCLKNLFPESR